MRERSAGSDDEVRASFAGLVRPLIVVAAVVALASGVALTVVYRPHSHGWLRTAHSGGVAVALISSVALVVVSGSGGVRRSRSALLIAGLVVLLLGAAFATGPWMAWTGGRPSDRGILLASGARVRVGGRDVGRGGLVAAFAVHVGLTVCVVGLLLGGYLRTKWRRRRVPQV